MRNEALGATALVAASASAFASTIGALGAGTVKVLVQNSTFSPLGIGLACGLIPVIAYGIFAAFDGKPEGALLGFLASYPTAVLTANLFTRVTFLQPVLSLLIGGTVASAVGGLVVTALACYGISTAILGL